MTGGPVNAAALAGLRDAAVSSEGLLRSRRVQLEAARTEQAAEERAIAKLEQELRDRRINLRRLDKEVSQQLGYLEARRLNGSQP